MIDTVRYYQPRTYSYPLSLKSTVVAGSVFVAGFRVECVGWDTYLITHTQSKMRAKFCANALRFVEVSLSRVLFGHNGRLISCQREIGDSFEKIDGLLNMFSRIVSNRRTFRRVDLVWQFKADPAAFANAHMDCRHPMIHQPAINYKNNGLLWKGSRLKISMYDKLLRHTKKIGQVVRVEAQLRGKVLSRHLGNGSEVTALTFNQCYQNYRDIIQGFRPKPVPKVTNVIDLIAFAVAGYNINLWSYWSRRYKKCQSRNRARKQLLARKLTYFAVDWEKLLPATRPLWKVNIDCKTGRVTRTAVLLIAPRKRKFCP
jgi:hypothetical protein